MLHAMAAFNTAVPDTKPYWWYAAKHAVYLGNRSPSGTENTIPYEKFTGRLIERSFLEKLPPFGVNAYVHIPKQQRRKLDCRAKPGIFIGIHSPNSTYQIFYPDTGSIVETIHVRFEKQMKNAVQPDEDEDVTDWLPNAKNTATTIVSADSTIENQGNIPLPDADQEFIFQEFANQEELNGEQTNPQEPHEEITLPARRSKRTWKPTPQSLEQYNQRAQICTTIATLEQALVTDNIISNSTDPQSVKEALQGPLAAEWQAAMDLELQVIKSHGTFQETLLQDLSPTTKVLGSKFVFKTKTKDGVFDKYKARLVVHGHRQLPEVHYNPTEIFSPVAAIQTGRCALAMAAARGWAIRHSDVQSAFVQAPLKDTIYVKLPTGYPSTNDKGQEIVYKLLTSLYGIRQAPRAWYELLHVTLLSLLFTVSKSDPCLYLRDIGTDTATILCIIVDDILELSPSEKILLDFETIFATKFVLSSVGNVSFWNGIKITYNQEQRLITLSQGAYIRLLLQRFGLEDCKPTTTPMDSSIRLTEEAPLLENTDAAVFMAIIGGLMYAACSTQPAIQYAVNQLAAYMSKPKTIHLQAAKHILRYLKGQEDLGLTYKFAISPGEVLITYSDSSWGGDIQNARSTTGTVCLLNGAAILWQSHRQHTTALSSCEAEYMALADSAKAVAFLTSILDDIGLTQPLPLTIYEDNQPAIHIAMNPISSPRTRHINVRYHYIREKIINGEIVVKYLSTEEMVADIFTKPLDKVKFVKFRTQLHGQ